MIPYVSLNNDGGFYYNVSNNYKIDKKESEWLINFIIETIVSLQTKGIEISFPSGYDKSYKNIMEEILEYS